MQSDTSQGVGLAATRGYILMHMQHTKSRASVMMQICLHQAYNPCRDFVPRWRNLQICGDPRGGHDLLGSKLFSRDFTMHPIPPEDYLYQKVQCLRPRVAAKPQSEFKLGLNLRVKGKSPTSLSLWKGARMPTPSCMFFGGMWHCHSVISTSFSEWYPVALWRVLTLAGFSIPAPPGQVNQLEGRYIIFGQLADWINLQ